MRAIAPFLVGLAMLAWSWPAAAQTCPGGVPGTMRCVTAGATEEINAYGVCRRITNPRPLAVMVPLGSAAEWQSLRDTGGSGLLLALCYSYGWSEWSGWSGCSAGCGGGTQSRGRECRRSETGQPGYSVVDASLCGGATSESQACNTHSCCTPNTHVTGYGGCSAGCGGGQQDVHWSNGCGSTWTSQQACNTHSCASFSLKLNGSSGNSCWNEDNGFGQAPGVPTVDHTWSWTSSGVTSMSKHHERYGNCPGGPQSGDVFWLGLPSGSWRVQDAVGERRGCRVRITVNATGPGGSASFCEVWRYD